MGHMFKIARSCAQDADQDFWKGLAASAKLTQSQFRPALSDLLFSPSLEYDSHFRPLLLHEGALQGFVA